MFWAIKDGEKATASPYERAICPGCGGIVVAKCGESNAWHWSHASGGDCDPWYEPESVWHLGWKRLAGPDRCEVVMGPHRADVVNAMGRVIELQHSPLSPAEVREREAFYGPDMTWLIDASTFLGNLSFTRKGDIYTFRWRWPRKWVCEITRTMVWDLGPDWGLFLVRKIYPHESERQVEDLVGPGVVDVYTLPSKPCRGWGVQLSRLAFIEHYINPDPSDGDAW